MADRKFMFFEVASLMEDAERLAFYDAIAAFGIDGTEPEGLEGSALIAFTLAKPTIEKSRRRAKASADNGKRGGRRKAEPKAEETEPEEEPSETEAEPSEPVPGTDDGIQMNLVLTDEEPSENLGSTDVKPSENLAKTKDEPSGNLAETLVFPDEDEDVDVDDDVDEDSLRARERAKRRRPRFKPPSIAEIQAYADEFCRERGIPPGCFDPEEFWNFYDSKGWMVGKNKMTRWKSAVAGWIKRNAPEARSESDPFDAYA